MGAPRVHGNVQTPALVIEEGAIFEGVCRMLQAKAEDGKDSKADKPRATAAPARPEPAAAKTTQTHAVTNQTPAHKPAAQKAAVTANTSSQAG